MLDCTENGVKCNYRKITIVLSILPENIEIIAAIIRIITSKSAN